MSITAKQLGLLVALLGAGLFVVHEKASWASAPTSAQLLTNTSWAWTSWTEATGTQPPQERILPCMRDNIIRFAQHQGQQVYTESAGALTCPPAGPAQAQGEWSLSPDGRRLTIAGPNLTFEDTWHIAELTASRLKLAFRTTTSQGPFVMTMTFVKR